MSGPERIKTGSPMQDNDSDGTIIRYDLGDVLGGDIQSSTIYVAEVNPNIGGQGRIARADKVQ